MGGVGSGSYWRCNSKKTTDDYRAFDVRRWYREGLLEPGELFTWQWSRNGEVISKIGVSVGQDDVMLSYRSRAGEGEWKEMNYPVMLVWTTCNYGGKRPWFLCPTDGCGRRVAKLYGGSFFACRNCQDLVYKSQRESDFYRLIRRADRLREQLGWEPGLLNGKGLIKPKGMHWKTYQRLVAEYEHYHRNSIDGYRAYLDNVGKVLNQLK